MPQPNVEIRDRFGVDLDDLIVGLMHPGPHPKLLHHPAIVGPGDVLRTRVQRRHDRGIPIHRVAADDADLVEREDFVDDLALFGAELRVFLLPLSARAWRFVQFGKHVLAVLLVVPGELGRIERTAVDFDQAFVGVTGDNRRVHFIFLERAFLHFAKLADLDFLAALEERVLRLKCAIGTQPRLDLGGKRRGVGQGPGVRRLRTSRRGRADKQAEAEHDQCRCVTLHYNNSLRSLCG